MWNHPRQSPTIHPTSSLRFGNQTIKASYSGDPYHKASSGWITEVVARYPTSTTFTSSLNPSIYGQAVTFTATVVGTHGVTPTGQVAFTWGGIYNIGSAKLNSSGVATLTKSNLNADSYPLTAVYQGDTTNAISMSAVLNQVVQETTSAATITSSLNPSKAGQAVTFTATISSPTAKPTGPATFTAGNTVLGTAQLSGGKATLTTSSLPAGSTKVTVIYNGDSNIAKSSASVTQVVQP
jgi:Bacterial Ig-like domain (group 3)